MEALSFLTYSTEQKKLQKSANFGNYFDFCPSPYVLCPLQYPPPTQKSSGAPTDHLATSASKETRSCILLDALFIHFEQKNYTTSTPLINLCYHLLYNLYKDFCPLIGWIMFIIWTVYRIRWQNILLHFVWVGKNAKIHLSPHENICTIALINIHYLYTSCSQSTVFWLLHSKLYIIQMWWNLATVYFLLQIHRNVACV